MHFLFYLNQSLTISVCKALQTVGHALVGTDICKDTVLLHCRSQLRREQKQLRKEGNCNHGVLNDLRLLAIVHVYFMIMVD